jgi:hypothetical protein
MKIFDGDSNCPLGQRFLAMSYLLIQFMRQMNRGLKMRFSVVASIYRGSLKEGLFTCELLKLRKLSPCAG